MSLELAAWENVLALAARLKEMEKCGASEIEGQPCIIRDVRFIGRSLTRIATARTIAIAKEGK